MKLPNIDFMMNMTKDFLDGKIDGVTYSLDFPYELEKRYKKMHKEDDDYCELIVSGGTPAVVNTCLPFDML